MIDMMGKRHLDSREKIEERLEALENKVAEMQLKDKEAEYMFTKIKPLLKAGNSISANSTLVPIPRVIFIYRTEDYKNQLMNAIWHQVPEGSVDKSTMKSITLKDGLEYSFFPLNELDDFRRGRRYRAEDIIYVEPADKEPPVSAGLHDSYYNKELYDWMKNYNVGYYWLNGECRHNVY